MGAAAARTLLLVQPLTIVLLGIAMYVWAFVGFMNHNVNY